MQEGGGLRQRRGEGREGQYHRVLTDTTDTTSTSGDMTRLSEQGQPRPDLLEGKGTISDRLLQEEGRAIKRIIVGDKNPMSRVVTRIKKGELKPLYNDLKTFEDKERIQAVLGMSAEIYKAAIDDFRIHIDNLSSHTLWEGRDQKSKERAYDAISVHFDILECLRYRLQNDLPDKGRLDAVSRERAKRNIGSSHRSLIILHQDVSQGICETERNFEKFSGNKDYNLYRSWMENTHEILMRGYQEHFKTIEQDFEAFDDPNKPNRQDPRFKRAVELLQNFTTVFSVFEQGVREAAESVSSPEECLPKLQALKEKMQKIVNRPKNEQESSSS